MRGANYVGGALASIVASSRQIAEEEKEDEYKETNDFVEGIGQKIGKKALEGLINLKDFVMPKLESRRIEKPLKTLNIEDKVLDRVVKEWSNKYKTSVEQMKAKRDNTKPLPQAPTEAEIKQKLKNLFVDGIWCEDFFLFVTKTRDSSKKVGEEEKRNVTFYLEIWHLTTMEIETLRFVKELTTFFDVEDQSPVSANLILDPTKRFAAILIHTAQKPPFIMVIDCTSLSQLNQRSGVAASAVPLDRDASETIDSQKTIIESACRQVKQTDHIIGDKILMNFLYESMTELVPNLVILNQFQLPKKPNKQFEVRLNYLFAAQEKAEKVLIECKEYNALFQQIKIVGMHLLSKFEIIYVYQDGTIEYSDGKNIYEQKTEPTFEVDHTLFTSLQHGHLLVMIGKNQEVRAAYRNKHQKWSIKFASQGSFKYQLQSIYGNFFIGLTQGKPQQLVLIEMIEMDLQQKFITELVLAEKAQGYKISKYILDAERLSFIARYDEKEDTVSVKQFVRNRLIQDSKHEFELEQICNGFLIRINLMTHLLEILQLDPDRMSYMQPDKSIMLPSTMTAKWFLPVMNPDENLMLLQLSDHIEKGNNEFHRYCSIILIDIEQEKAYTYEGNGHSSAKYLFIDQNRVMQENPNHIEILNIIINKPEGKDPQEKLTFRLESEAVIMLDCKGQESNIFGLTKNQNVLAFSEHTHSLYVYRQKEDHDKKEFDHMLSLELQQQIRDMDNINFDACYIANRRIYENNTRKPDKIVIMAALPDVLYLHTFNFEEKERKQEKSQSSFMCVETTNNYEPIPISKARSIHPLSDDLVAIQCNSDIVVYDLQESQKILNIDFKKYIYSPITAWNGWLAIQKGLSSIFRASSPVDWEWHSVTRNNQIDSLHELSVKLTRCYREPKGYIQINESFTDWHQEQNFSVVLQKPNIFSRDKLKFSEFPYVRLVYRVDFNLWENLIFEEGFVKGKIDLQHVNDKIQIGRIFNPIMSKGNQNLLFEFAKKQPEKIKQAFKTLTHDKSFFTHFRVPFFMNFECQNALNEAVKARDYLSFQALLDELVNHQNRPESAILVDSWLSAAIQKGIQLTPLFESKILTQEIKPHSFFTNYQMFPTHHSNSDTVIKGYKGSFNQLTHDQNAYKNLFGAQFSSFFQKNSEREMDIDDKNGDDKNERSAELVAANQNEGMLYPISYTVDHYFTFYENDKHRQEVMNFVEALSTTDDMTYFKAAYVQRLLLHIWEDTTKYQYWFTFSLALISQLLIQANTVLLNYEATIKQEIRCTTARMVIDSIIFFCIFTSSTFLNVKKAIAEKGNYLLSWNNQLEIIYTLLFLAQFGIDAARFSQLQEELDPEIFEEFKNNRLSSSCRIINAFLVFFGGIRLLNQAQIIRQLSFMIKMVRKVSYELIPFVLLFLFAMTMFGFVFGCLDLPFGDDYSCIGLNGDNYKFFVKPYQKWYGKTTCNDIIDSLISDLPSNDAQEQIDEFRSENSNQITFIGWVLPMIFWVIRTSLGDFDVQRFQQLPVALQIASWAAWVVIVVLNMLIFLNFLIAVIGDVYGQVMETRLEEQYQTMALVIREMDLMFNSFPSYQIKASQIAVARQVATEDNYEKTQGFLVQIKGLLSRNFNQIESLASKLDSYNRELYSKIKQTCSKLDDEKKFVEELTARIKMSITAIKKGMKDGQNPFEKAKQVVAQESQVTGRTHKLSMQKKERSLMFQPPKKN